MNSVQGGRVFLIHGWTGYPEEAWRPWMKVQLEELGFQVSVPQMNRSMRSLFYPRIEDWIGTISENVVEPDENTFFISQSLGAVATLRYIERLGKNKRIGGAVLIAGFTHRLTYPQLHSFFEPEINYNKVAERCDKFEFIHCRRDVCVPVEEANKLHQNLGGKLTITESGNHFMQLDGVRKLPEARDALVNMAKLKVPVLNR
ncbi:MAG: RBBP9/YdeN family alpha/beta hydrolase [Candidatus Micrarchaeales archaeon]